MCWFSCKKLDSELNPLFTTPNPLRASTLPSLRACRARRITLAARAAAVLHETSEKRRFRTHIDTQPGSNIGQKLKQKSIWRLPRDLRDPAGVLRVPRGDIRIQIASIWNPNWVDLGAPGGCWSPERERVMSIHAYMCTYMQKHITNNIRTYIGLTQAVGTPLFGCCFQSVLPWFCVSIDASCGNPLFRFCSQRALPWCCVSIDASCGNPPLQILFSECVALVLCFD